MIFRICYDSTSAVTPRGNAVTPREVTLSLRENLRIDTTCGVKNRTSAVTPKDFGIVLLLQLMFS